MPRHVMARPSPRGKGAGAGGTDSSMEHRTMASVASTPMPTLHATRKTLPYRSALHIHGISGLENICFDLLAQFKILLRGETDFSQKFLKWEFALLEALYVGLASPFFLDLSVTDLNRLIPVLFLAPQIRDNARAYF